MITDTSLYRFASGEMNGRPLDEKGLSWSISTVGGKLMAVFSDGTMTPFYVEGDVSSTHPPKVTTLVRDIPESAKPYHGMFPPTSPIPDPENKSRYNVPKKPRRRASPPRPPEENNPGRAMGVGFYDRALKTKLKSFRPGETMIARYKTVEGLNPTHPCEPVYGIYENNVARINVDRNTVGTGLREYLWLYQELRELGRRRWAAVIEAWQIYVL